MISKVRLRYRRWKRDRLVNTLFAAIDEQQKRGASHDDIRNLYAIIEHLITPEP